MYGAISNAYQVLHYKEFFEKFKLTSDTSRFISKAYKKTNNTVSVFEDELDKDCYFQCPDYGESYVPEERRYIYLLKANTYNSLPYTINTAGNKKRYSINIDNLIVFADPYNNGVDDIIGESLSPEEELIRNMKMLIKEYEQRKGRN